ncbi:hypothetical protein FACS189461_2460 [Spirochaetia bacterium]|nr:hypothetical protein FACS189461_2460 [Spirochaetia bacterium]
MRGERLSKTVRQQPDNLFDAVYGARIKVFGFHAFDKTGTDYACHRRKFALRGNAYASECF